MQNDNTERRCAGCGVEIQPGARERNKRKWCSGACRVASYRANCGQVSRMSYLARITELEAELARIDPSNELLNRVPLS